MVMPVWMRACKAHSFLNTISLRMHPTLLVSHPKRSFFATNNAQAVSRQDISGPEYQSGLIYTKTDKIENAAVVWAPCGATGILNVNNRIALTSRNRWATGELTDDDATVAITQQIHVTWQRC